MYRAKAKTIVGAVSRRAESNTFSLGANYGTRIQRRLSYVELAEKSSDWNEFVTLKYALQTYGTIRAAVIAGHFD